MAKRQRVTEKANGAPVTQPKRRKTSNRSGSRQGDNGRDTDPDENHARDSSASTDPLNIVGSARAASENQSDDDSELLDNWSLNDDLYQILLKGTASARQQLRLVNAKQQQKTISDAKAAKRLKEVSGMFTKMATISKVMIK